MKPTQNEDMKRSVETVADTNFKNVSSYGAKMLMFSVASTEK